MMQERSFGFNNLDNSNNNGVQTDQIKSDIINNKKMRRLQTDNFQNFQRKEFQYIKKSNTGEFRTQALKEMVRQAKFRFFETVPNTTISGKEEKTVPYYIKERDDQIKKVKSFKSPVKQEDDKDDDVNKKVFTFLIQAFLIIFLILFGAQLFIKKYL